MFKKIMLSALCIFAAASVVAAPRVRIDQSSKEAVVETFIRATAYDDPEAMWAVLDPSLRQLAINEAGSEAQAIKDFWAGFRQSCPASQNETFKQILRDPAQKKEVINMMLQQNGKWFIRKNGKWYINPLNK